MSFYGHGAKVQRKSELAKFLPDYFAVSIIICIFADENKTIGGTNHENYRQRRECDI